MHRPLLALAAALLAGCSSAEAVGRAPWTDADGAPVPDTRVVSFPGPEHCGWQATTFLHVDPDGEGGARPEQYLGHPAGELQEYVRITYDADARLPADAEDTGWRSGGRQLWLVPDRSAAYLVSEADPDDVERWPATRGQVACA